ncbi:MAG: hypothetical protein ACE5JV_02045 [Nitrososphaerales archaeon]
MLLLSGAVGGLGSSRVAAAAEATIIGLDKPTGPEAVDQGQTLTFTGQLVRGTNEAGIPDATVNIVQQISFDREQIIASGQTDADGVFFIPWTVDVTLVVPTEGGSFGGTDTQGRENRYQVVIVARFDEDDQFARSVSTAQSFEVRLNALSIKVEKKEAYLANESAQLKVLILDGQNNRVDPDTITARFNNDEVTLSKESTGTYTFFIGSLSPGTHTFSVLVTKIGHTTDDELVSLEARQRNTSIVITTAKSEYALGDAVNIFASLIDKETQQLVSGRVVNGALTTPDFKVEQITFVDGKATYKLATNARTGDWTISASFAGDGSYFKSAGQSSFTVVRPTAPVTPPEAKEKVSLSLPSLVDQLGNPLADVGVGEQVMVQAKVASKIDATEEIVYITQVKDSEGITVALSWITGTLSPGQAFELAVSWIPDTPDQYEVEVFVWKSIKDPQPLSFKPKTLAVTVS